ncbi:MAG TPA: hypothetical protein VM689_11255 [Aliidongia sp.]|nr:hypothetical protein [Aliidongia sp.]
MQRPPPPKITDGIPAGASRNTPLQLVLMLVIGTALLALFASRSLPTWAEAKGDGTIAMVVDDWAERWADGLERLGLTRPHDVVRRAIRRAELKRWK